MNRFFLREAEGLDVNIASTLLNFNAKQLDKLKRAIYGLRIKSVCFIGVIQAEFHLRSEGI